MYEFRPIGQHYDRGLGAIAEAFKESGDRLMAPIQDKKYFYSNLPVCYLYRHAVELFLKSIIFILHRRLSISWEMGSDEMCPAIRIAGRVARLEHTHSITLLYKYMREIINARREELAAIGPSDWNSFPSEMDSWIQIIEAADAKGTFFRYPSFQKQETDLRKSEFREMSATDAFAQATAEGRFAKVFIEENTKDSTVRIYAFTGDELEEVRAALSSTAEFLSLAHFAARMELSNGQ